jgi:hypothetical protein
MTFLWRLSGADDTVGVPDIPTGRSDICTILVSAPDNTSFNIFMIAGVGKLLSRMSGRKVLSLCQKHTTA